MNNKMIPSDSLVIMVGVPGSGKSTTIEKTEMFKGANVVSTDKIRGKLFGDEENNSNNDIVFETFYNEIDESLKDGKLTIADSTAVSRQTRKDLYMLAAKYKRPIRLIVMNIQKELAKSRNNARQRVVPDEVIDRMYEKLETEYNLINEEITKLKQIDGIDINAIDIVNIKEGDER